MPLWGILLIGLSTLLIFTTVHYIAKSKHPFKRGVSSMLIGAGALTAVNLLSAMTGVYIPVSLLSIIVSVVGGVPGVTLIMALNLFF